MLHLTAQTALQAALLTNCLYGALIMLPARARASLAPDDMPWVLGLGAAGHLLHALTTPGMNAALISDICLICGAIWILLIGAPAVLAVVMGLPGLMG